MTRFITPVGRKARVMMDELHNELHEEHPRKVSELEIGKAGEAGKNEL